MKANFIGAVIVCALAVVQGNEYVYLDDKNQTCIEVKMDITFTLTNGTGSVELDANNFTVLSGDCASATEAIATMTLQNGNQDFLAITFLKSSSGVVNMSYVFTVSPSEYFPGVPIPTVINLNDQGDLLMGSDKQLYKCDSPQKMTLTGELEGVTYSLVLDMSNAHIQAFNIQGGNLSSNVFMCSADQMTTLAAGSTESNSSSPTTGANTQPTTEPPATQPTTQPATKPSNETTTSKPSIETTTANGTEPTTKSVTTEPPNTSVAPITTPAPPSPPAKSTYQVMEDGKVCLIMEGSFQLSVTYARKDNTSGSGIVNVPVSNNVNVTGKCGSVNDTTSQLIITPKEGDIKSMTFNFEIVKDQSQLVSWSAEVSLNNKSFPDAKGDEIKHTVNDTIVLSDAKLYYKCDVGATFKDDTLGFMVKQFRVQAFNVEDGKFSDNGIDCKQDVVPNPKTAPSNTFSLTEKNNTCIVFKGRIQFNIPYMSKLGNTTAAISLPTNYTLAGTCNTTLNALQSQNLVIEFYDSWKLTIYFSSDVKQNLLLAAAGDPTKFSISQIELEYDYNNNLFGNVVDSMAGLKGSAVAANVTLLSTSAGKSYLCNKASTFDLHNGLSMAVTDLQYQAFKKTGNSTEFGEANECAGDEDTNSIVPIAVGAALAGLVIIVLIAYLIGRKRSRSGYEQV